MIRLGVLCLFLTSIAFSDELTTEANPSRVSSYLKGKDDRSEARLQFQIVDSLFYLSPGDQMQLRWWGISTGSEKLGVNPQGDVVIPEIGTIHTRGLAFDRVRDSIEAMLRRSVRPKTVDLQLLSVVPALVGVLGRTAAPGIFEVPAGTRLSVVLSMAGWDVKTLLTNSASRNMENLVPEVNVPSARQILLVRGPKRDTVRIDLATSMRQGDPKGDVRLFTGDQIILQAPGSVVAVSGQASSVGFAEYLPGETLGAFMKSIGADPRTETAMCQGLDGAEIGIKSSEVLPPGLQVVRLSLPERKIFAPTVWVNGLVRHPGVYPLTEGLDAKGLIAMAGGVVTSEDSTYVVGIKRDWPYLQAGRNNHLESVYQYGEVRLALSEYQILMRGNYSDRNPLLQPGDTVNVNPVDKVVWVSGQVARPGFVAWKPGAGVDDYIRAAGGYAGRPWTSRIKVYDFFTQQAVGDKRIPPGAAIVVPERRYIYPEQWITIAATVISLVVATYSLYLQTSAQ